MSQASIYDILIAGCGPAGMTAALYAARANKKVAIFDGNGFGGNIAKSPQVENIPGFKSISGADFSQNMFDQISALSNVAYFSENIVYISYKYGLFILTLADKQTICGKSLIIATGTKHKELNLATKDTYYCVTCDGPFFKNKNVLVLGSGNTGATYALELSNYCKNVYLCDMTMQMNCEATLKDRVQQKSNIYWLPNSTVKEVKNSKDNKLTSVTLSTYEVLKCSAIFVAIGVTPATDIFKAFIDCNDKGYIISSDCSVSKVPGVFVAGDCRDNKVKQVVTAVSDGACAALKAIEFLDFIK